MIKIEPSCKTLSVLTDEFSNLSKILRYFTMRATKNKKVTLKNNQNHVAITFTLNFLYT